MHNDDVPRLRTDGIHAVALNVLPTYFAWQHIIRPCIMSARCEGIAHGAAELARYQHARHYFSAFPYFAATARCATSNVA